MPTLKLDTILSRSFRTRDPAVAFAHFLPLAPPVAPGDPSVYRRSAPLARHNVDVALKALLPPLADIAQRMPSVDVVALAELPSIALALVHAADRVPLAARSARPIDAALAVVRPLRAAALDYLEVAAKLGLVPAGRVRAIREGSGPLDTARDCLAIVATFREHGDALRDRHPFTPSQFDVLAEKGAWLVQNITPMGGRTPATSSRTPESIDRDRIASLLEQRYDQLRAIGVVCFGIRRIGVTIPPLWSSRRDGVRAKTTPDAPTPPQPDA